MHALLLAAALLVQSPDSMEHRYTHQAIPDKGVPEQIAAWWIARDSIWQIHKNEIKDGPDSIPTLYACMHGTYDTTVTYIHKVTLVFKDPANQCSGGDVVGAFIIGDQTFDPQDLEQRHAFYDLIGQTLLQRPDWIFIGRAFGVSYDADGTWPRALWVVWTVPGIWVHVPPERHSTLRNT